MSAKLIDVGTGLLESGKYKEAITCFTRIIDAETENSKAFELRGVAHYMLMNTEEAIDDLSKSILFDKNSHLAFSNRGQVYLGRQDYENAAADFMEAIAIVPENIHYKLNLAYAYLILKKIEKALPLVDQVLELEPSNNIALLYKADCLTSKKKFKDAIQLYQKVISNNYPVTAGLFNGIGFCQLYTNELNMAKNNFHLSIELDPGYAYPWDNLGYAYYLEKNYSEALKLINHSLELDPSNSWAYKNRAIVYMTLKENEKAVADLEHSLDLGYSEDYDNEVETLLKTITNR